MGKRFSIEDLPEDVAEAIRESGSKGGKARAKNLSKGRRREIAKKAAAARWNKQAKKK